MSKGTWAFDESPDKFERLRCIKLTGALCHLLSLKYLFLQHPFSPSLLEFEIKLATDILLECGILSWLVCSVPLPSDNKCSKMLGKKIFLKKHFILQAKNCGFETRCGSRRWMDFDYPWQWKWTSSISSRWRFWSICYLVQCQIYMTVV